MEWGHMLQDFEGQGGRPGVQNNNNDNYDNI